MESTPQNNEQRQFLLQSVVFDKQNELSKFCSRKSLDFQNQVLVQDDLAQFNVNNKIENFQNDQDSLTHKDIQSIFQNFQYQQMDSIDITFDKNEFKAITNVQNIKQMNIPNYNTIKLKYKQEQENLFDKKQDFLTVSFQSNIELSKKFKDQYPFFKIRKNIRIFIAYSQTICLKIIKHHLFEFLSLLIILINSVQIALQESVYKDLKKYDQTFTLIYLIEMLFKIFALGFIFNKNAYMKDPWNVLDFFIVVSGIISDYFSDSNLSALRVLRVLRPLRTVSKVKSLKLLINTLFQSFSLLKDSLVIMLFYYTVFAISGNQIFSGSLKYNCFQIDNGMLFKDSNNLPVMCNSDLDCLGNQNLCGKQNFNPQNNLINFDTFIYSFLQVYQSCTFEGWSEIMTLIQISNGFYYWIFCFIMVFIGAFVIINLILAVVAINFLQSSDQLDTQDQKQISLKVLQQFNIVSKNHYQYTQGLQIVEEKKNLYQTIKDIFIYFSKIFDKVKNIKIKNIVELFSKESKQEKQKEIISEMRKSMKEYNYAKSIDRKLILKSQSSEESENEKKIKLEKNIKNNQIMGIIKQQQSNTLSNFNNNSSDKEAKEIELVQEKQLEVKNPSLQNLLDSQPSYQSIELKRDYSDRQFISRNIFTKRKLEDIQEWENVSSNLKSLLNESKPKDDDQSSHNQVNQSPQYFVNHKYNNFFQTQSLLNGQYNNKYLNLNKNNTNNQESFQQQSENDQLIQKQEKQKQQNIVIIKKEQENNQEQQITEKDNYSLELEIYEQEQIQQYQQMKDYLKIDIKKNYYYNLEFSKCVLHHKIQNLEQQDIIIKNNQFKNYKCQYEYIQPILKYEDNNPISKHDNLEIEKQKSKSNKKFMKKKQFSLYNIKILDKFIKIYKGVKFYYDGDLNQFKAQKPNKIKKTKSIIQKQNKKRITKDLNEKELDMITNILLGYQIQIKIKFKKTLKLYYLKWTQTFMMNIKQQSQQKEKMMQKQQNGQQQFNINNPIIQIYDINCQNNKQYQIYYERLLNFNSSLNYHLYDYDIWDNSKNLYYQIQRVFQKIILNDKFEIFILLLVMCNTCTMLMNGIVDQEIMDNQIQKIENIFSYLFIGEMILKLTALTPQGYVMDKMNILDGLIAILAMLEIVLYSTLNLKSFRTLKILRSFKVIRVGKLLRSFQYFKVITQAIQTCFTNFANIFLLLIIFIFIFTLLGKNIFGSKDQLDEINYDNQFHWNSLFNSFLNTFQIMTVENWPQLFFNALSSDSDKILSILYFVLWIFGGNYVLLNLFLAILLDSFTTNSDKNELNIDDELEQKEQLNFSYQVKKQYSKTNKKHSIKSQVISFDKIECEYSLYIFSKQNKFRQLCYKISKHKLFEYLILRIIILSSLKLAADTYINEKDNPKITYYFFYIDMSLNFIFIIEFLIKVISQGFIYDYNSYLQDNFSKLDFLIVVFSIIDMILENQGFAFLKIIRLLRILRPLRFISHNPSMKMIVNSLFQSISGIFNVVIIIIIFWMMFAILFTDLFANTQGFCNGVANFLVEEYENNRRSNSFNNITKSQCNTEYFKNNELKPIWINYDVNYDNILQSFLSLFILSTLEGWNLYMVNAINGSYDGPVFNNNQYYSFVFIAFILIGSIFCINLFVAIVGMNFHLAQMSQAQQDLTQEQIQWIQIQQLIQNEKIDLSQFQKSQNKFKQWLFVQIRKPIFELIIIIIIFANLIVLSIQMDGQSSEMTQIQINLNYFFTFAFIIEFILKLFAIGYDGYFHNSWNQFDFFVVVISILDLIIDSVSNVQFGQLDILPQLIKVFRIFRVTRILKLIKNVEGLRKLIGTIIFSLPSLLNVTSLVFLVYYIFTIFAQFLFKDINFIDKLFQFILSQGQVVQLYDFQVVGVQKFANFKDFQYSFITLFRQSTGEDWEKIMFDMTRNQKYLCYDNYCMGSQYNVIFFILYTVIVQYIMLNLFILVLMQNFEDNYISQQNPIQHFQDLTDNFKEKWIQYCDTQNIYYMKDKQLLEFILNLEKPLGLGLDENQHLYEKFQSQSKQSERKRLAAIAIMKMYLIPNEQGNFLFNEILFSFYRYHYDTKISQKRLKTDGILQVEMAENQTIRIIEKLKQETKKKANLNQLIALDQKKNKNAINPMMEIFYMNMIVKAWINYSGKFNVLQEQLQKNPDQTQQSIESVVLVTEISSSSDVDDQHGIQNNEIERDLLKYEHQNQVEQEKLRLKMIDRLKKRLFQPLQRRNEQLIDNLNIKLHSEIN